METTGTTDKIKHKMIWILFTEYIFINGGFGKGTQSKILIARTMIVNYKLGEINARIDIHFLSGANDIQSCIMTSLQIKLSLGGGL